MAKVQYTIRIEEPLLDKAKIVAEKEMRSLNNLFEYYIAKGLEEHEKANASNQS